MKLHVYTTAFCYVQCDFNLAPNYSWSAGESEKDDTSAHNLWTSWKDVCEMSEKSEGRIISSKATCTCLSILRLVAQSNVSCDDLMRRTFSTSYHSKDASQLMYLRPSPSPFITSRYCFENRHVLARAVSLELFCGWAALTLRRGKLLWAGDKGIKMEMRCLLIFFAFSRIWRFARCIPQLQKKSACMKHRLVLADESFSLRKSSRLLITFY